MAWHPGPHAPLRKPHSLAVELTGRLREQIMSGALPLGHKLPTELELVETMGVSRTVVREAISALKSEHLVLTRQGVGAFVVDRIKPRPFEIATAELACIEDAIHILELRMAVEIEMAGAAAQRRRPEHLKEMWRQYQAIDAAQGAGNEGTDADFALHRAIAQGSGNPYFLRFIDFLGARIIPPRSIVVENSAPENSRKYLARIQREHRRIVDAIAKQKVKAAMAAMRVHLGESRDRHRERLNALRNHS